MFSGCNKLKSITATQTVKEKILNSNTSLQTNVKWNIK